MLINTSMIKIIIIITVIGIIGHTYIRRIRDVKNFLREVHEDCTNYDARWEKEIYQGKIESSFKSIWPMANRKRKHFIICFWKPLDLNDCITADGFNELIKKT